MKHESMRVRDFFKWDLQNSQEPDCILPIHRRYYRNFFYYAFVTDPNRQASAVQPEFLGRFFAIAQSPDQVSTQMLDAMYFIRSAHKIVNPQLVEYRESEKDYYSYYDPPIPDVVFYNNTTAALCHMIYYKYRKKWMELSDTYFYEYDPIENYNMNEQLEDQKETEYDSGTLRTDNLQRRRSGSEQNSRNLTDQRTLDLENETSRNLTDTITYNTSDTKSGSEQRTLNTSDAETITHGKAVTKSGSMNVEKDKTETTTPDLINDSTNSIAGFNSATPKVANTQHAVTDGQSVTDTDETETTTYSSLKDQESGTTGDTTTHTGTDTMTFNNVKDQKTGTETTTRAGTETETETGTDTMVQSGTETRTYNNVTDAETGTQEVDRTGTDSETHNYTLTRSGNIGVTTTQQMIQQQRELLLYDFLNEVIFPDIDRELTLSVY